MLSICGPFHNTARARSLRHRHKLVSRWRKPRLYLTLVAFALILSLALSGIFFSIGHEGSISLIDDDGGIRFAGIIPLTAYGWLLILAIPTTIGAAALLSARKLGIFISLAILPILAFTLGMSIFFALQDSREEMLTKLLIDFSIASIMAMLGPLLLGWKRIRWIVNPTRRVVHTKKLEQKGQ